MKSNELVQALELARRVESIAVGVFERDRFQPRTKVDLLAIAMAVRCMVSLRGVIRCAEVGLADPAMVIARSLLEQIFVLLAIARAPNEAEQANRVSLLEAQAEHDRAKAVGKLQRLPSSERSEQVTDQWLSGVKAGLGSGGNTRVEDWARFAGMSSMYDTAYARLSLHVHPSYLTLYSMTRRDTNHDLLISAKPHQGSLPLTVLLACDVMGDALSALQEGFVSAEAIAEIEHCHKASQILMAALPEIDLNI
jgi:hypothetical protein